MTATPEPPDGMPVYRLLIGSDDEAFCRRVSEALALGYRLHGGPTMTTSGKGLRVGQVVIWPDHE